MLTDPARRRKKALRLWAWRWSQKLDAGAETVDFEESYSCARDCQLGTGWNLERRKGRGCTRPGLPPVRWQITAAILIVEPTVNPICAHRYRGRYPNPRLAGTTDLVPVDPDQPHERTADGCPGGWYRTSFVDSLAPYTRRRTEHGARVDNPLFSGAPWQVQEAAMYWELEQERWFSHRAKLTREMSDKRAAKAKRKRKHGHR